MTDKNITEGLIEKDSINTPDNQAPVQKLGSFEDPSSYLKEVSTFVNLEGTLNSYKHSFHRTVHHC